jgi:K+ transporter
MSFWRTWIYTLMAKNQMRATRHFVLPPEQVVEVKSQIQV